MMFVLRFEVFLLSAVHMFSTMAFSLSLAGVCAS